MVAGWKKGLAPKEAYPKREQPEPSSGLRIVGVRSADLTHSMRRSLLLQVVVLAALPFVEDVARQSYVTLVVELERAKNRIERSFVHRLHKGFKVGVASGLHCVSKDLDRSVGVERVAFGVLAGCQHLVDDRLGFLVLARIRREGHQR